MSFTSETVDKGTNPTAPVAVDQIGGIDYQRNKLADPNADQTGAYGIDTNPMRVRSRRHGTADYDSGSVAVAAALTAITASTVYLEGLALVNLTSQAQAVDVTDTAGAQVLSGFPLAPNTTEIIPFVGGVTMVGLKAAAGAAGVVLLRAWGNQ